MATNAYKGSSLVQRIYHGTAIEYNRHNWNKYNVTTREVEKACAYTEETHQDVSSSQQISSSGNAYTSASPFFTNGFLLSGGGTVENDTVGAALSRGAIYVGNSFIPKGEYFLRLSQIPGDNTRVRLTYCLVVSGGYTTEYVKGSTSYGVVQGYAGDYPNNGKQGNYWYEKVNA